MSSDGPNLPPATPNPASPGGSRDPRARIEELQADRAVQGLSGADEAELRGLLERYELRDDDTMERAAAAAHVAIWSDQPAEQMPGEVRERLLAAGRAWAAQARTGGAAPAAIDSLDETLLERKLRFPGPVKVRPQAGRMLATWGGWLAAAACLTIMATYSTRNPAASNSGNPIKNLTEDLADLSPVAMFDRMDERLASGESLMAVSAQSEGMDAELRFDPGQSKGYLAIAGLDASDASDKQYQVWVLDEGRRHPVSAGVFDVSPTLQGAKIVVPVRTQIPVRSPAGIAVSVESRGGVVLPDPDRIIFKASMPQVGPPAPSDPPSDV